MIRSVKSKLLITILVAVMIVAISGVSVALPNKTVTPPGPIITSISPTKHTPGDFSLTIKGQNFGLGAVVSISDKNKKLVCNGTITSGSKTKLVATVYMGKASPDVYDVNVKNPDGNVSNNAKLTITTVPVAAFTGTPTAGKAPLTVSFTDKSTGSPTSWSWNFGDGKTSKAQNPTHKYTKAGKYTVSLTVKNDAGSNTTTKKNYINVTSVKPVAAFSAKPTSGKAPLKVQFTDKSTGSPTSWKWSFGDGTSSTSKSPSHTYKKAGKYTVKLTVKNDAGSNTKTVSNYIVVK